MKKTKLCKQCLKKYSTDTDHHHICDTYDLYVVKVKRLMESKGKKLSTD